MAAAAWVAAATGLALALAAGGELNGMDLMRHSGFVRTGFPHLAGSLGGYTEHEFRGFVQGLVLLPVAGGVFVWAVGLAVAEHSPVVWTAGLALSAALTWVSWTRVAREVTCGVWFCAWYGPDSRQGDSANGFDVNVYLPALGLFALATLAFARRLLLAVVLTRVRKPASPSWSANMSEEASGSSTSTPLLEPLVGVAPPKPLPPAARRSSSSATASLLAWLALLSVCMLVSVTMPNSWLNWTAHKIRINAKERVEHQGAFQNFHFGLVTRPEEPQAWFKTSTLKVGDVLLKFYPDVWMFYSWAALTTVAGYALQTRAQVLRAVLVALTTAFAVGFVMSWWYHNWAGWFGSIKELAPFIHPPTTAERLARTAGQVLNVILGLLFVPATRHSVVLSAMHTSFEQTLAVHRSLGNCFLLVLLVHIASWWAVYSEKGTLRWGDAWSGLWPGTVPMYFPLNQNPSPDTHPNFRQPQADNFTIPSMNVIVAWVVLPVFGVLTLNHVRRRYFEVFHVSHQFAVGILVLAVLYHAASAHVFVLPGLALWGWDRIMHRSGWFSHDGAALEDGGEEGVVRLVGNSESGDDDDVVCLELVGLPSLREARPGQFVMLHVPSVSLVESHPFTLSRCPAREGVVATVHVKRVGHANSFTRRLTSGPRGRTLKASVEGPYGSWVGSLDEFERVVLVAGGVGITPVHALLMDLAERVPDGVLDKRHVLVLWSVKSRVRAERAFPGLFSRGVAEVMLVRETATQPRLDVQAEVDMWMAEHAQHLQRPGGGRTLVFACGPEGLSSQAREVGRKMGAEVHVEAFAF